MNDTTPCFEAKNFLESDFPEIFLAGLGKELSFFLDFCRMYFFGLDKSSIRMCNPKHILLLWMESGRHVGVAKGLMDLSAFFKE